jgi:hypothetical protein
MDWQEEVMDVTGFVGHVISRQTFSSATVENRVRQDLTEFIFSLEKKEEKKEEDETILSHTERIKRLVEFFRDFKDLDLDGDDEDESEGDEGDSDVLVAVEEQINSNHRMHGWTELIEIIMTFDGEEREEKVRELMEKGADPNIKDCSGASAIDKAIEEGLMDLAVDMEFYWVHKRWQR